jgi:hypothetical protein
MAKQVQIKESDIPENWSQDAADMINKVTHNLFFFLFSY